MGFQLVSLLNPSTGGAADGVNILAAGSQTANTTGTVSFANSNGLSFGMSNNSIITAAHNALTTAMQSQMTSNFMSTSERNNYFFTSNNTFLTTAMQSDAGSNFIFASAGKNLTNISATLASNSISLSVGNYITTAMLSQNTSLYLSTSQSSLFQHTSATSAITANALNTSQSSLFQHTSATSAITANAMNTTERGNYFSTAGYTFANSTHSHGNPTLALTNLTGTTASASNGFTLSLSAAAPGAAAENNWMNLSGNVAGNTTASGSTINFVGGNNITLSGLNNSQIRIDGAAGGGGGATFQFWQPFPAVYSTSMTIGHGSLIFQPIYCPQNVTASRAHILVSCSISVSSSRSHGGTVSLYMGLYTRNVSTLSSASSGSATYAWTNSSNASTSVLHGLRLLSIPLNLNMTPGEYWLGFLSRTATAAYNYFTMSNIILSGLTNQFSGSFMQASNSTRQIEPGYGRYSNVSTNAMPSSAAFSHIHGASAAGANKIVWCQFLNSTF